jgi:hypothetical protein
MADYLGDKLSDLPVAPIIARLGATPDVCSATVTVEERDDLGARRRLDSALDAVDAAFAHEPDVGIVDGCTYCFSESDLGLLGGDPRLVSDDLVGRFARKVTDHWSPEQYGPLWRRFAPRIIRLLAAPSAREVGLLVRGMGSDMAGFGDWPAAQRSVILGAFGAALDVALVDGRPPWEVVDLVGAVSHVDRDIAPWTARLETLSGPSADAGFVRLVCDWALDLIWEHDPYWWWYPEDPIALGTAWVCSAPVSDRIGRFADLHPHCKNARDALTAIAALRVGDEYPWPYPPRGRERARRSGLRDFVKLIPGMG